MAGGRVTDPSGWLHVVLRDPAGGLSWGSCPRGPSVLEPRGRYVVTGASGALGGALARHLARRWQARLVLVGRRSEAPAGLVRDVEDLGGRAEWRSLDLTNGDAATAWARAEYDARGSPDALFHLAGTVGSDALAVKRDGLLALAPLRAKRTALWSSISGVLPGLDAGIEAYAEANRWLDAHAEAARARGERVTSIAWGPWAGAGMAAGHADAFAARGIAPIPPDLAMEAMEWALSSDRAHVVVLRRASEGGGLRVEDEAEVRRLFALALGRREVPDHEPLARLGLDSVAALDLVREIEQVLGRDLPTTLLFEHRTLGGVLGALRDGASRQEGPTREPSASLLPSQETFATQRAYFPDIPGNVLLAVTVRGGTLDRRALAVALDRTCARHPVLRAAVRRDGGRWVEVPGAAEPVVEWTGDLDEMAVHNAPFDLEEGPLLRVVTDGRRLVLDAAHVIVDAWSLQIVASDLLAAHEAALRGEEPPWEPLRAGWPEARRALRDAADPDVAWWEARYADGVPPLPLPWDGPVDAPTAGPCGARLVTWDEPTTQALTALARDAGVTLPALVLASYVACLARWSGQHDVVVRVAQGRREVRVPDVERIVGSFADSLPVRVRVRHGEGLADLAVRVADALREVQAHAGSAAVALGRLGGRSATGPVGVTPAGFSFPPVTVADRVGDRVLEDTFGASANGFTRLGLIAWVASGSLRATWNHAHSHLRPGTVARLAREHHAFLEAACRNAAPMPRTLHGRVVARCRAHSQRRAVGDLAYGALDRRSAALARRLRGPRVAVLARPGADAAVALLGVLRAGAAYVPLEPEWPDARIAQVLAAAAPSAVVAPDDLAARAASFGWPVEAVPGDDVPAGDAPDPDDPDATAYVMFTSGSTGAPKGVVVRHGAVMAFQDWVSAVLGVTEADRFVWTSSIGFGGHVRQLWAPLLHGAVSQPVPPGLGRDPDALVAFLRDHRITVWNSVPSVWTHLLDALERVPGEPLPDLRWALLGGEAVPAAPVRRWRARFGSRIRLANLYGATETVVNATWHEVVRDPPPDAVHVPVGWPRSGVDAHLVGVVDGVGEIVVSGAIADRYLDTPDADAFVEIPGVGRAWRTGDLARRDADGALVYLGRRDGQVQVYGNRVELPEIEHTLVAAPGVRAAVVVQAADGSLAATVEGGDGDLRAWVAARLPAYMVPHRIDRVGAIPRTAAGKVDRKALAAPSAPAASPRASGSTTDLLASAWAEVLGLEAPPGPTDDFFALGGDSIRLLAVIDRVRPHVPAVPSPLALFARPSLAAMALAFDAARTMPAAPRTSALTAVQRGFWLAHQADPAHPPTWAAEVPVDGPLDVRALREALRWLVARHPMLRSVVADGPSLGEVAVPAEFPLQVDDLEALPDEARAAAIARRWREEASARLDPARWPPFRVRVVREGPDRHRLILSAHHLFADAWAAWVLLGEVLAAHDAFAAGRTPDLPPAPHPDDHRPAESVADPWWHDALADLAQGAGTSGEESATTALDPATWDSLRAEARRRATSPFVLVLTALFDAIREVVGGDDTVVATAIAAREGPAVGGVVAAYAKALPVRVRGPVTVDAVSAALAHAMAHADADSLPRAARDVGLDRVGRFFLSWLDPAAVPRPPTRLVARHAAGRHRFAARSTGTEVLAGALVEDGLRVALDGGPVVPAVAAALGRRLRALCAPQAALVVYLPPGASAPGAAPLVIERVDTPLASSEIVLLPIPADALDTWPDLDAAVADAIRTTSAPVVALAGRLPTLTGLGTRPARGQTPTTGHAVTVVAVLRTGVRLLRVVGRAWADTTVGFLGYGPIGRAAEALMVDVLGPPRAVLRRDPRLPGGGDDLADADLVIGATSGRALDIDDLRPGTLVVDDSFPRAFDDDAAIRRMTERRDVLLVGGGMIDVGPLVRTSPFAGADALRDRYGSRWLPGCHAEAVLLAIRRDLGPTVGVVDLPRARAMLTAVDALGWTAPPLHLGGWLVPDDVIAGVRAIRR